MHIRKALSYEPEDYIGRYAGDFVSDDKEMEEIIKHHRTCTDDNFIMTNAVMVSKSNAQVFVRSMAFALGNITLHLVNAYPGMTIDQVKERIGIQKFRCDLGERNAKSGQHVVHKTTDGPSGLADKDTSGTARSAVFRNVVNSLKRTHQACIVLEGFTNSSRDDGKGARVVFSTDSINRILNVDSCDLQNLPFLSLVALQDITRAAAFLDKTLHGNALVLERLRLLENPLEDSQLGNPKCVAVEFMAMGSDDGAIMLCQLDKSTKTKNRSNFNRANSNSGDGYLSLEDIISSDAETSDFVME
ncbi:hypothetical protein GGI12_001122 [Dipsacomyces acuminosporus]|nr:hypothetical protein GGI12_001122 [Dipsacomyces acuminosporus]